MNADYCPYCNSSSAIDMTDEHVIPESIGGDSRTIIRVCKRCNNNVGRDVDTTLSSNGWMRMNAMFAGGVAKRQDRLETTTTLKDGRKLEGYFFFTPTDNGLLPGFEPKRQQPDGTLWISEDVKTNLDALPPEINIFRRDMVEYWGYYCPPARTSGMERAMLKVLLGIVYMDQGRSAVESHAFDVIRSSLTGSIHRDVQATWFDKPMQWGDSTVRNHEHAVYFECEDRTILRAGVALFGTGIRFEIQPFDCFLPKRCVRWDGRPGPPPENQQRSAS